jgi:demethylmenaquinone methyltransferase/2-methoxy-6-polyprenyl-1,4-benzoquinol methylase
VDEQVAMIRPHEPISSRYADEAGKRWFIRDLFNRGARHYNRIGRVGFLGTGHFYRKRALLSAGLRPGMHVLDVACGTGAVTRAIAEILSGKGRVCGLDPSEGMIAEARKSLPLEFQIGHAEDLPFPGLNFDFLSMGYALRHVADLQRAFAEFHRVLRPCGRLMILEVSRPRTCLGLILSRLYFRDILPGLAWVITGSRDARVMMSYYWETIDACVPPATILETMARAGFQDPKHHVELGIFSTYTALNIPDPS